jgi:sirohydrochlorin cobaltochelatase
MGLRGEVTQQAGRTLRYAPSLADHPYISRSLQQRALQTLHDYALQPDQTAVAIVGHGTPRTPASREATRKQVALLRSAGIVAEVVGAYLDDDPAIPEIYQMVQQANIIVIPYFLALGSHTTQDVPRALGLAEGQTQGLIEGHQVYYTLPIGLNAGLSAIILELAGLASEQKNKGSIWDCFPKVGAQALTKAVLQTGGLSFGQLWLTPQVVCHQADIGQANLRALTSPAELRQLIREAPFRPLATLATLPQGWRVDIPSDDPSRLAAVVETVYPSVLASWGGDLPITSLEALAERQTGIYAQLGRLSAQDRQAAVQAICSSCILHPQWHDRKLPVGKIACPEACNWWMSHALGKESE